MMLTQRCCSGDEDWVQMKALVQVRPTEHLHVMDLPYRFSSWAFDEPRNTQLWFDGDELVAWAALQTPFWSIDYAIHPEAPMPLLDEVLTWADARARECVDTAFGRPTWFINAFSDAQVHIDAIERAGFRNQADVGENAWSKVWMHLDGNLPDVVESPSGYQVRSLAGENEVAAYVATHRAAFNSENMTVAWRARTLRQPNYVRDTDVVAVTHAGDIAAFCVGWLDGSRGQVEPMGVHPEHQRHGLGRAVLLEGLRRLAAHGATDIYVETDNYRDAALALYEAVGFRVAHNVWVFRKDYTA